MLKKTPFFSWWAVTMSISTNPPHSTQTANTLWNTNPNPPVLTFQRVLTSFVFMYSFWCHLFNEKIGGVENQQEVDRKTIVLIKT